MGLGLFLGLELDLAFKLLIVHGVAQKITLDKITTQGFELDQSCFCFNAFRSNRHAKTVGQIDDGADNFGIERPHVWGDRKSVV